MEKAASFCGVLGRRMLLFYDAFSSEVWKNVWFLY